MGRGGKRAAASSNKADLTALMQSGLTVTSTGTGSAPSSSAGAPPPNNDQAVMKYLAIIPVPDGRACITCSAKDSDPDIVYSMRTYIWNFPPNATSLKNVGCQCYYCGRVFAARFKPKYKSVTKLVEASLFRLMSDVGVASPFH